MLYNYNIDKSEMIKTIESGKDIIPASNQVVIEDKEFYGANYKEALHSYKYGDKKRAKRIKEIAAKIISELETVKSDFIISDEPSPIGFEVSEYLSGNNEYWINEINQKSNRTSIEVNLVYSIDYTATAAEIEEAAAKLLAVIYKLETDKNNIRLNVVFAGKSKKDILITKLLIKDFNDPLDADAIAFLSETALYRRLYWRFIEIKAVKENLKREFNVNETAGYLGLKVLSNVEKVKSELKDTDVNNIYFGFYDLEFRTAEQILKKINEQIKK